MGLVVSIVIGLVSFMIALSAGNPVGGIIFGVVMFGMSYGAFAWRPGEQPPPSDSRPKLEAQTQTPRAARVESPAAFSPNAFQVGQILAGSLIEGHDPDEIDPRESSLLFEAGISEQIYKQERFVLRASIAAFSIRAFLVEEKLNEEVASGFYEWFTTNSQRSERAAQTTTLLQKRLRAYAAAAQKEWSKGKMDPNELNFNEVAFVFGECLAEQRPGDKNFGNACATLAVVLAPIYWQSQLIGASQLFQRAGLLKQRESAA